MLNVVALLGQREPGADRLEPWTIGRQGECSSERNSQLKIFSEK